MDAPHSRHDFFRTLGIVMGISVGLLFPQIHGASFLIAPLLMTMLFFIFLGVHAPLHALRWSHFWLVAWNFAAAPLAYWIVRALGGSQDLALASLVTAITPTATAAPVVIGFLGGKVEYVLLAALLTLGMFSVVVPFLLPVFLGAATPGLHWMILQSIGLVVFVPLLIALIVRRMIPQAYRWQTKSRSFTFLLWNLMLCLMASNVSSFVWERRPPWSLLGSVLGITFLLCVLNFGIGFLLGGREYRRECSQSLGQKNTALTFYIALTYADPMVALGPCMYILWHNLWNAIQLGRPSLRENSTERATNQSESKSSGK